MKEKAPRGPQGLTSSSVGRIAINNNIYCGGIWDLNQVSLEYDRLIGLRVSASSYYEITGSISGTSTILNDHYVWNGFTKLREDSWVANFFIINTFYIRNIYLYLRLILAFLVKMPKFMVH
jgi:hypothetical protein